MKKTVTLFCLVLMFLTLHAQNRVADSLLKLLPKVSDEKKIDLYNEIGLSYRGISFSQVKAYCSKSYILAQKLGNPEKMATALTNMAIACVFTGNTDSAQLLFNINYKIADSTGDRAMKTKALLNLGNFYYNTDKFHLALDYFQKVYPEYRNDLDTLNMAAISQNIGNIWYHRKDYPKALEAFHQSFTLFLTAGLPTDAGKLYNNIGLTMLQMKQNDSALYYLNKGLQFARNIKDRLEEMYVLNNLGILFRETERYDEASNYYHEALAISREIDYPHQEANYLLNLADVYLTVNRKELAFNCLDQAAQIIEKTGTQGLKRDLNEHYYRYFLGRNDYKNALRHYQLYQDLQDSIFGEENLKTIDELNIRFETAKKEAENIRLKSELDIKVTKEKRLIIFLVIISLLLAAVMVASWIYNKYQRQKQTIASQESQLLKERLEHTRRELASNALRMASQNELRTKLITNTRQIYDHLDESGKENLDRIIRDMKNQVDHSAWHEFSTRFEQVHESFYTRLNEKFPDLTPNDRRLCAFLKLNMSSKDIALLTHRSPRSIESARYRLKKKFGLSPDEDILSYLQSL